jgi:hypothetical protein
LYYFKTADVLLIAIGLLAAIYVLDALATLWLIPELKGKELD